MATEFGGEDLVLSILRIFLTSLGVTSDSLVAVLSDLVGQDLPAKIG
jgi:hypothetical protein